MFLQCFGANEIAGKTILIVVTTFALATFKTIIRAVVVKVFRPVVQLVPIGLIGGNFMGYIGRIIRDFPIADFGRKIG